MFCHIGNHVLLHFNIADTDETLFILENKNCDINIIGYIHSI